ncbi:TonB-dependent receptor plug domain-containing protein [Solitalea koreensis]|uniref:TonB-dependent outer membrane receptor, SusC/RagA subfamily, signature region n=1 Tax=Solitalea koreensis TaxID=543615 RepID=A0A521CKL7_9SPHI|nr:TonB-dependent receptor plug domain-containing protein [Solitalea koreensis]SMO60013.1 TonB-dependent outer membrane receptor, SusC/RagA subfamily, signature region [Solitalea koreensis]
MKKNLIYTIFLGLLIMLFSATLPPDNGEQLIKKIMDNLANYHEKLPQEKIYLHIDKPYYGSGDNIYFKAYLVHANDNTPSELSKVIYVDMLNAEDKPVERLILKKDHGDFNGSIPLSDSIPEGIYRLRAYTSWMRNFGEDYFYSTNIKIGNARLTNIKPIIDYEFDKTKKNQEVTAIIKFNNERGEPIVGKEVQYEIIMVGRNGLKDKTTTDAQGTIAIRVQNTNHVDFPHKHIKATINYDGLPFTKNFYIPYFAPDIDLQFFPEGGSLVNELPCVVGFKAVDVQGKGADVKGYISDEQGNKIVDFQSSHLGMGKLAFVPKKGHQYKAFIKDKAENVQEVLLPEALDKGLVLSVRSQTDEQIRAVIMANPSFIEEKQRIVVVGLSHGVVHYAASQQVNESVYQFTIPKEQFPTGIAQITVFNSIGQPLAERLVFINRHDQLGFSISTDKANYRPHENVNMKIIVQDPQGKPVQGDFSLAVTDNNVVQVRSDAASILSNLLFTSDLQGHIEDAGYYFDGKEPNAAEDLDVLLLTQGWRRYEWSNIIAGIFPETPYPLELGLVIAGKVKTISDDQPAKNAAVTLFTTKNKQLFQATTTNNDGEFQFTGLDFPDSTRFIIQARNEKGGKAVDIEIFDSFHGASIKKSLIADNIGVELKTYLKANKKEFDFRREKLGYKTVLLSEVVVHSTRLPNNNNAVLKIYSTPDAVITAEDISRSSAIMTGNLLDAIRGRVAGVDVTGNTVTIRGVHTVFGNTSPLVVLDGAEVDVGWLRAVNPIDVESIEFLKGPSAAIYGMRGSNGVIAIYTKRGNFLTGAYSKKGMLSFYPEGYQVVKAFYEPKYNVEKERKDKAPDARTTIYWNGNIKTGKNGEALVSFYTADSPASYTSIIEGLTASGQLGRGIASIRVDNSYSP